MNKYNIGQKVFTFNRELTAPIVCSFIIETITRKHDKIYYSSGYNIQISEQYIYPDRSSAYKEMIQICNKEMSQPEAQ